MRAWHLTEGTYPSPRSARKEPWVCNENWKASFNFKVLDNHLTFMYRHYLSRNIWNESLHTTT
jgi:hypothetical protein